MSRRDPWETAIPGEAGGSPTETTLDARALLPRIQGYEVLEVLGEGGMGIVCKARHLALDRLVALKMLKGGAAAGPQEQQRFRGEAEAAAKLRHPGIVQIYEVGQSDGVPFFAMELVEGGGLDVLLRKGPLPPTDAAHLVERAAEAIAVAHEHRIIHRDLKPANVMLQFSIFDFGLGIEDKTDMSPAKIPNPKSQIQNLLPKITDFGLAKKLDEVGLSVTGQILGTPSYMAPEQAKGQVHEIGPAADVYALGAILYECLTGRPPFQAASVADTLLLVLTEDPAAVRRLQPRVPRDLETICHKCLHKEPQKRYGTAQELAEDLRRFRDGRTISARPVSAAEHAYRWYRRHPALAWLSATVALLLLAVTVVSVTSYFKVSRTNAALVEANNDLQTARQKAEDNAERARKSYALASRSMEQTVFRIAGDPYLKDQGFFELRKELLAPAARFYRELVEIKSDDPKLEADRGRAFGQLAAVRALLGETEQAAADFRAKMDVFASLAKTYPDEPTYRLEMSKANRGLGTILRELARYDEANAALVRAGELALDLVTRHPDQAEYLDEQIGFEFWRGVNALKANRNEEARKTFLRTLDMQEKRDRRFPTTRTSRDARAGMHTNLAAACLELKRYDEALTHYQSSLAARKQLHEETPGNLEYLYEVVSCWQNLGVAYQHLGRLKDAEAAVRESHRLSRRLLERFPMLPASRMLLAHSCHNFASWLLASKRPDEAMHFYREATVLFEGLAADFPGVPNYRKELGMHYTTLGGKVFAKNPAEGLGLGEKAVHVLSEGMAADRRDPVMRQWLAKAHLLRSSSLGLLGRWDEAQGAGEQALALDPEVSKDPKVSVALFFTRLQAQQLSLPALRLARAGKHVEAARTINLIVERRALGSMHALAGSNVLTGIPALATARSQADRDAPLGTTLFDAACVFALCAGSAAKQGTPLVESYAKRAVEMLGRARDAGYFAGLTQQKQLDTDRDLELLRKRKDFQELRREVADSTRSPRRGVR